MNRCSKLAGWVLVGVLLAVSKVEAWQMQQAPLMTRWAALVDTNAPWPEYPRPQMVRTNWLNLNGLWQFQAGATNDPVPTGKTLSSQILVPFPMESAISGVMQYHEFSWYRRTFTVPAGWAGQHVILHLDAVTWQTTVYVNGQEVGLHKGGYDPFSYDITSYLNGGTNELILQVYSPEDNGGQPRGKQTLYPGGIMYTSASGIWQTAWLEPVDASGISTIHIVPNVDGSNVSVTVNTYATSGVTVAATVLSNGVAVSSTIGSPDTALTIRVPNEKLWSPDSPFLYGLQLTTTHNGVVNDQVASYFGMRKISLNIVNGIPRIYLNNQPYFQMGPLDQGYWPDGIYTPPTDDAMKYDLQVEKQMGFNAVRKHEKVEPQRWYYWADTLGLMVWQDMPTCNSYTGNANPPAVDPVQFMTEVGAMVTNHWNSPCIVQWEPFNEGQGEAGSGDGVGQTNTPYVCSVIKTLDPTRLVDEASGGTYYGAGDVYDNHNYPPPGDPTSTTQAAVDGEYGGIGFLVPGHLWNASEASTADIAASSEDDIATLFDEYANDLVNYKPGGLNAAIETQTTDVENECDGLLTYDRFFKTDPTRILLSNEKAISGQFTTTTVVPTSQVTPQTWSYTTNTPAANWYTTGFNSSSWKTGLAGFGTTDPGVTPNTPWTTKGYIYLRRTFNPGALTAQELSNLVFTVYHDEDVVIYINGVEAASDAGYTTSYISLPVNAQRQAAIITNGVNVLAVSCHQTTGGQFIDVGLSEQTLVANTLTVPTDAMGYWPLDATSGNVAVDASGNGNNAVLTGTSWNPNGEVNGCLSFNGQNSSAQINNTISNDFSIAFWVKTTQTAGTGQWYNGAGLVDGSEGVNANDFGTALAGGQFAFGVGNPDTTILSTTAINDGNWHECVATRVQSTGAMNLYVDGNWEASGTGTTNTLNGASSLLFGALAEGGGNFNGSLDEIQIYNRALGSNEITALYNNTAVPPAAPEGLTAVAGNGVVTLDWFETLWSSGGYSVGRATTSGGPYTVVGTTSTPGFTDTNVVNGTTYYYAVASVDVAGAGTNSAEVSARPANLAVWYRADAIAGVANGAALADWPDVSGSTNDATQTTAAEEPIYVKGAMNGLPVVRFNSTNSTFLAFNRPVQDDFTILVVYQSSQTNQGTGTDFYQGAGLVNGDVPFTANDFGTALNANGDAMAGTGNPDTSIVSGGGFNDGKPHVVAFQRAEATGAITLYVDGNEVANGVGGTNPLTAPPELYLGAVPSGGGFLTGDIAEVKIYNSVLSPSDLTGEENSLECKYGISGGGVPSVPQGLAGVAANGQVHLTWQPVAGADSYNVLRSANGTTFTLLTNVVGTAAMDATVASGQTNYYEVVAVDDCGASSASSAVSVIVVAPPALAVNVNAAGSTLSLTWPTSAGAGNWALYFTTNLAPPVAWEPVTNTVSSSGGQLEVTLPLMAGAEFFRLESQ